MHLVDLPRLFKASCQQVQTPHLCAVKHMDTARFDHIVVERILTFLELLHQLFRLVQVEQDSLRLLPALPPRGFRLLLVFLLLMSPLFATLPAPQDVLGVHPATMDPPSSCSLVLFSFFCPFRLFFLQTRCWTSRDFFFHHAR